MELIIVYDASPNIRISTGDCFEQPVILGIQWTLCTYYTTTPQRQVQAGGAASWRNGGLSSGGIWVYTSFLFIVNYAAMSHFTRCHCLSLLYWERI